MLAAPRLHSGLVHILDAFWEIGTCRSLGMGAEGPVPFDAIDRFAGRAGIVDQDEFARFRTLVRALDREYLGFRAAQAAEQRDQDAPRRRKGG